MWFLNCFRICLLKKYWILCKFNGDIETFVDIMIVLDKYDKGILFKIPPKCHIYYILKHRNIYAKWKLFCHIHGGYWIIEEKYWHCKIQ